MGPKGKPKTPKGKAAAPAVPEIDPNEVVTELQKEFFEFQLADIEKKINRISTREEELTAGTQELEEKIEEYKKEKGAIVTEHEQLLAAKEEEKCMKREEMLYLSDEIKIRIEKHKEHIQNLERKFEEMVTELTAQLEELEEEVRILEDYKQNKDIYGDDLEKQELEIQEMEKQHQRNLFAINTKFEEGRQRVKKELQARLLLLSIEFRQKSQKRIGNPCHRVTQENKAINSMLMQMKEGTLEYDDRTKASEKSMKMFKIIKNKKQHENEKMIAMTIVQVHVKKTLLKESLKLVEKLKEFTAVDLLNRNLLRRLHSVTFEIARKTAAIDEINHDIDDKVEETNVMKEAVKHMKKNSRRLLVLIRGGLKIADEAMAVRLIPMGGMEEEKHLTSERKIKLFRNRRDMVFVKKGRILQYLLDFLSKAQLTEEDKKLLRASTESIDIENINFSQIYGKALLEQESKASVQKEPEEDKKKGPVFFSSLTSLPRSVSTLFEVQKKESEAESYEGEFGEYGSYEFDQESRGEQTEEEEERDNKKETVKAKAQEETAKATGQEETAEPQESPDEGIKLEEEKKSEGSVN